MMKTKAEMPTAKIAVDIDGLQEILSAGRVVAREIGEAAGAVIRVGRRRLYNVKKVQEYLDNISEA